MEKNKEEKKSYTLKHIIPLNLSIDSSRSRRKSSPLAACDCDNYNPCDCDDICGVAADIDVNVETCFYG